MTINAKGTRLSAFLVAGAGLEPATFGLCIPRRLSPPDLKSVCGLDFPFTLNECLGCLPSSLYTFSEDPSELGSGLPFHRLPRIWQVITNKLPYPQPTLEPDELPLLHPASIG